MPGWYMLRSSFSAFHYFCFEGDEMMWPLKRKIFLEALRSKAGKNSNRAFILDVQDTWAYFADFARDTRKVTY